MSQVKIYGLKTTLDPIKHELSNVIHACIVEVFKYPENKRAHRFFCLDKSDFYYPEGRSESYVIIELMMIQGRTKETKKALIKNLFKKIHSELRLSLSDIEICIQESPAYNWGFRGMTGDEVSLNYKIEV